MRRVRILAYTDAPGRGGGEISLGNLVGALPQEFDVRVAGADPRTVAWIAGRRPGTRVSHLPLIHGWWDLPAIAAHAWVVWRVRPDVLHVNLRVPWVSYPALLAGLALPGTRVVAVEQLPIRTSSERARRWKRLVSARLDAHVAVGERSAREVEEYAGLPSGSVRAIRNCVPETGVRARPSRRRRAVRLVSVGRLDGQKGFDVLLRALAEVPTAQLSLVGDGDERERLARLASELGVADRVQFEGWREDVGAHLAVADVFVLPSRSEGFPLSIVEAMLAGLPVVATAVGSVAEAVSDGETGLLVGKDDPYALAAALRKLAEDPPLRRRMGAAGRERAARELTVEHMAGAFAQLYEELLSR